MQTWGKGLTGIVLACTLAACGGGDGGSNGGFADPNSFTVSATVGGAKVQSINVGGNQTATLTVKSGQDLRLDTDKDVNWNAGNKTSYTDFLVKGASTQSWTASSMSPPGGTFTVTATSAKDASKSVKVTVTVTPHEYTSGAPQTAGRVTTWTETTARLSGGAPEVHERVNTTTNVDSTTGYATMPSTVDGVADETYTQDADGNRIKRKRTDGSICTYTPKRTLVSFPLSVNKSWTSAWMYSCDTGYQETVNATSTVEAYEPVTIASGTFNALRIHHVQSITKSTDGNLPSGTYGIDMRCWWDVAGQRTVKCDQTYTYKDTAPANYVKTFSQDLKSVK
ncbi:putative lipoprotein [Ralstonia insidiosa]|uniref:Lipoprotein n=1 Tax=Ralstonia insidiosa TaxID=190721 RepID=A0AAC9FQH8_9RALS|nr:MULTISPECIES: hypothetical protein [Ralstonia]ANH72787.1 putative lipoprotein [Ralstonia insidiosa]EPX95176.1 hypothetical protein C404_22605 [Ralstonia sp. AU12-08]MBY4708466.1 hypothetical protein [Ralstonia insidiosa]GAQ29046.1 lipoprotein [Ralstonia sp. NT80]